MTTTRRAAPLTLVLALVVLALAAAACGSTTPERATYTFDPGKSPVRVDTPELRALKAKADIAPCPASSVGTEGSPGSLPDLTLPCLGGGRDVDLAGLRGPLLLNFWSQTCGPCQQESPLLEKFSSAAKGKVRVIGVDFYDPRPSFALAFAKQHGLTYPQVADPEAAAKGALHIVGLPMTLFVDGSGRVAYTQVGALESESQLDHLVRSHLGVDVSTGSGT